jgi:hypothetical protein
MPHAVRNQKAASLLFSKRLADLLGLPAVGLEELKLRRSGAAVVAPSDLLFTIVREPAHKVLSAYLEISRRKEHRAKVSPTTPTPSGAGAGAATYRSIPCTEENAVRRFEAFLDDIERGRDLGDQGFHVRAALRHSQTRTANQVRESVRCATARLQ